MLDPLHASEALRYKVDHLAKPGGKRISINYFLLIKPVFHLRKTPRNDGSFVSIPDNGDRNIHW